MASVVRRVPWTLPHSACTMVLRPRGRSLAGAGIHNIMPLGNVVECELDLNEQDNYGCACHLRPVPLLLLIGFWGGRHHAVRR